jgi:hypothetical protein
VRRLVAAFDLVDGGGCKDLFDAKAENQSGDKSPHSKMARRTPGVASAYGFGASAGGVSSHGSILTW